MCGMSLEAAKNCVVWHPGSEVQKLGEAAVVVPEWGTLSASTIELGTAPLVHCSLAINR